jgi:hypothetical protein
VDCPELVPRISDWLAFRRWNPEEHRFYLTRRDTMKRTKWTAVLVVFVVAALALTATWAVYAQGEGDGPREAEVGGAGLDDAPPPGYSVLYMFTGVANSTVAGTRIGTTVMCTNYGIAPEDVRVEMFSFGGGNTWFRVATVEPGETQTFSSQSTHIFFDDYVLTTGTINQGSGRVLATGHTVICTALLVDPDSDQPSFMTQLDMYKQ